MKTVSELRQAIAAKQGEVADLEAAGLPLATGLQFLQAQIDELTAYYERRVQGIAHDVLAARPGSGVSLQRAAWPAPGSAEQFCLAAIFKHLGPQIYADVKAEIENAKGDFPATMEEVERIAQLKLRRRELLDLERKEEAAIVAEAVRGNVIDRRSDASAAAILGIPDAVLEGLK